jgi:hypothetical protein
MDANQLIYGLSILYQGPLHQAKWKVFPYSYLAATAFIPGIILTSVHVLSTGKWIWCLAFARMRRFEHICASLT